MDGVDVVGGWSDGGTSGRRGCRGVEVGAEPQSTGEGSRHGGRRMRRLRMEKTKGAGGRLEVEPGDRGAEKNGEGAG
jgi:hypothetical protein